MKKVDVKTSAPILLLTIIIAFGALGFGAKDAWAGTYRGIYTILDIYSGQTVNVPPMTDLQLLAQAASPGWCGQNGSSINNKIFCKSDSGILLDIHWCEWEPDSSQTSCGKGVLTNGRTTVQWHEVTTACDSQQFDNCQIPASPASACATGSSGSSTLGTALYYICQINLNRLAVGLNVLKLSVGLTAGVYTPVSVITTAGYVDQSGIQIGGTNYLCGRQPKVWGANYVSSYEMALKNLLSYIAILDAPYVDGQGMAHNTTSPIDILKVTGLNENTLEAVQEGADIFPAVGMTRQSFTTPNPSTLPTCTYLNSSAASPQTPAQWWLSQYNGGLGNDTLIQAFEHVFGRIVGFDYALLTNMSASMPTIVPSTFLLSVGARNTDSMPSVNCGLTGTANCVGQNEENPAATNDQWSAWYLLQFLHDLLPNANNNYAVNTSGSAAFNEAANQTPSVAYNLQISQLALNVTNLEDETKLDPVPNDPNCSPTDCPNVSRSSLPCIFNNQVTADDGQFTLTLSATGNPTTQAFGGVGAAIAWQTAQSDAQDCDPLIGTHPPEDTYSSNDLEAGVDNGGQLIEISSAEAVNANCQAVLPTVINDLAGQTQPPASANCLY